MDSTDIERLQTASDELAAMLNEEELKDAALLVFANKQDQPGAKGAGEISEALRLGELRDRNWSIMACSAVDGSGVSEGMDWLVVSYHYAPILPITLCLFYDPFYDLFRTFAVVTETMTNSIPAANRQPGIKPVRQGRSLAHGYEDTQSFRDALYNTHKHTHARAERYDENPIIATTDIVNVNLLLLFGAVPQVSKCPRPLSRALYRLVDDSS